VTTSKESWQRVVDELEALGLKLKLHLDEAAPDSGEQEEVRDALRDMTERVQQGFAGLSNAVRDQAVRDDVTQVAGALRDALDATFAELGARLRRD